MVNPVSDNKILPANEGKANQTDRKGAGPLPENSIASQGDIEESQPVAKSGDSLDVERAKQLYNATVEPAGEGAVSTPDEAKALASQIARQIADDVAQALRSQAGSLTADKAALLEAAPA